ncbi:staphylococcal nuclease domain-containing protein 1-like [Gigantopelta aegis]|uniref:staphylococcal nuclease domain-containing protein 1-like n=1 Tax=Gigantopelta aegis TaxID=1735272 RepID=UPI001B88A552|nr:staphylococcal nuclease domain-containing protein 1-like [Gigantopelta aegis]
MSIQQPAVNRGIVKQVLSGDAVVIRGQPKGGPPPERTVCFSNIQAPKVARRANPNVEGSAETRDEPFAWEARELLRKKLIGREVVFTVEYKAPGTGREYGCVYLGKDMSGENMTEMMINTGLVEVRRGGLKTDDPGQQKLVQLEEAAKTAGKGKWASDVNVNDHIRDNKWTLENPRNFVDSHHNKPLNAVIEHVRDGCTVRAFILPSFHYVTVMISGIKCPMFKQDDEGKQVAEPFAEEAKFFTESRLLQRDVKIILEGVSNQNLLGTVIHPNGNIGELLLKEGFARCVDWSMGVVSQGPEKLRAAEKMAKEKKLRIWKDYKPSASTIDHKDKNYSGKVIEVVNGDALVVRLGENSFKKIFLASIRPPRISQESGDSAPTRDANKRIRPLYDIPYMYEAREFLRKKLIGKKVTVEVDYVQPPNQGFPEKTCCTVTIGGINVAEALVSKGLASFHLCKVLCVVYSGIECPRASRPGPGGTTIPAEPYGEEAHLLTKELCLQREVAVEVEAIDKGGNFIGWLFVDNTNLSHSLVEAGLAKVHFTAERSSHYKTLLAAQEKAKEQKLQIWSTYVEPKPVEIVEEPMERKVNHRSVIVTEVVSDDLKFYVQFVENGPQLDQLMEQLHKEMECNPPLPGAYTPTKGELCAARFSQDKQWYRGKIEKIEGSKVTVMFIDYGNKETMTSKDLAALPLCFRSLAPQATPYTLACILLPNDEDARQDALEALYNDILNKQLLLNVEYKGSPDHVTLADPDSKDDVGQALTAEGLVLVEQRKEKRLAKLVSDYSKAQDKAKSERRNIWCYGDFTEDDAKEFGYQR